VRLLGFWNYHLLQLWGSTEVRDLGVICARDEGAREAIIVVLPPVTEKKWREHNPGRRFPGLSARATLTIENGAGLMVSRRKP
jgi:hypothetical protein